MIEKMDDNMNDFWEKVRLYFGKKEIKKKLLRKDNFLLLILVGVLFMVIQLPVENEKKESSLSSLKGKEGKETANESMDGFTSDIAEEIKTESDYRMELEQRTEAILSAMEGAGTVKVMITLKNDGSVLVEKDLEKSSQKESVCDSSGATQVEEAESTKENTKYYTNEMGQEVPVIESRSLPQVEGILVVAEGGEDPGMNLKIVNACQALFGIEAHKIVIVKGNADERRTE